MNKQHCRMMRDRLLKADIANHCMSSGQEKREYDAARTSVSILTAHSSKGLEFKTVLFIGTGHIDEKAHTGDPTKILYVGMTRAREKLVLTGSANTPWVKRIAALAA